MKTVRTRSALVALGVAVMLLLAACHGAGPTRSASGSPRSTPSSAVSPSATTSPRASASPHGIEDSKPSGGTQPNKPSYDPSSSKDGRYVAFSSYASNLVRGDTNRASDVFVRDRHAHTIVRISVSSRGGQADADSFGTSISDDGRFVVFLSWATNLVPDATAHCLAVAAEYPGCGNAYVHDMKSGVTSRVSVSTAGRQGSERTDSAVISATGRIVAFSSWASSLVAGDTNQCSGGGALDEPRGCEDVFVRDLAAHTTERVSIAPDGSQFERRSVDPSMSSDGSKVEFRVADLGGRDELYVRDIVHRTTSRVPYPEGVSTRSGQRNGVLTGDGTQVLYTIDVGSPAGCRTDYAPPGEQICTSYRNEMYAYRLWSRTTERITPRPTEGEDLVWEMSTSRDGRYVMFSSSHADLVAHDRNHATDIFLLDRVTRALTLVSVSSRGVQGNGESRTGRISADGSFFVFSSEASNLVGGDTNRVSDVFYRDLATGTTSRVSVR